MSADQEGEKVLKKVSIFLVVFLLLSGISLSEANVKRNADPPKKTRFLSLEEKEKTPSKKRNTYSKKVFRVLATAYYKPVRNQGEYATDSFKGDMKLNGGGKTFTNKVPKEGMVAVDPKVIPLGTKMYIPELELYATAEDIGGDIKGRRIDIFTGTGEFGLEKALEIGRKMVTVVIIKRA